MSILTDILAPQDGIIGGVLGIGKDLVDRLIPDPAAKAEALQKLAELNQTGELAKLASVTDLMKGQLAVNAAEAASGSLFVAGWRPLVGWVCGAGLASQYVIGPLFTWATNLANHPTPYPVLDLSTMMPLLVGMLGFGYMRTMDKKNGTNNGH